ncbi:hypothetical protein BIW11_03997 [Tropilaelaps mercedesae]|uniref:Uncharacterized protein n=1 Tax=Tropilaelaps mercedesae TaxID=418985 RepID=A0A1V9XCN4_9ACAR|nr:hypothetical protein BIW11_03997 [Tropilaelaps mercedesae]
MPVSILTCKTHFRGTCRQHQNAMS